VLGGCILSDSGLDFGAFGGGVVQVMGVVLQSGDGFDGFVLFHYYCFAFLLQLQNPVVVQLLRRLSSLSL
jgi:hypothetical protein